MIRVLSKLKPDTTNYAFGTALFMLACLFLVDLQRGYSRWIVAVFLVTPALAIYAAWTGFVWFHRVIGRPGLFIADGKLIYIRKFIWSVTLSDIRRIEIVVPSNPVQSNSLVFTLNNGGSKKLSMYFLTTYARDVISAISPADQLRH